MQPYKAPARAYAATWSVLALLSISCLSGNEDCKPISTGVERPIAWAPSAYIPRHVCEDGGHGAVYTATAREAYDFHRIVRRGYASNSARTRESLLAQQPLWSGTACQTLSESLRCVLS